MAKKVKTAFIMVGRFRGDRANKKEDYTKLLLHNFLDKEGFVRGASSIEINKVPGYNYKTPYKLVVSHTDESKGTAVIQVYKVLEGVGERLVQTQEIKNDGRFQRIYLDGTDVVLSVGVADFWQQTSDKDNKDALVRENLNIIERITGLTLQPEPKTAKANNNEAKTSPSTLAESLLLDNSNDEATTDASNEQESEELGDE